MDEKILKRIRELEKESGLSSSDLLSLIRCQNRKESEERIRKTVESNSDLIGRCTRNKIRPHDGIFPEMYRYAKVVGVRSDNEYRVECLEFDEYPLYRFYHNLHKAGFPGDGFLGHYDFYGPEVKSRMAQDVRLRLERSEISQDYFNDALRLYTERLCSLEWKEDGKLEIDHQE